MNGQYLYLIRRFSRLSAADISLRTGLSVDEVKLIEGGQSQASSVTVKEYSRAAGLSVEEISFMDLDSIRNPLKKKIHSKVTGVVINIMKTIDAWSKSNDEKENSTISNREISIL